MPKTPTYKAPSSAKQHRHTLSPAALAEAQIVLDRAAARILAARLLDSRKAAA